ncbi:hypothetical protein [Embleya scabrispora]|uniref:hypothetical protein n=1 Tax=Embleya scabrispora TaxID=159449 RepID=UPI00191371E8|nr:hypothetical protein [Embleya scabrispora]
MSAPGHRTRFFDHRIPPLYAGTHSIAVGHTRGGDDRVGADLLPDLDQDFVVRQPRLQLRPDDVAACYPPPAEEGAYTTVLPHIALANASLPWLTRLPGTPEGAAWLALLVFRQGELPEDREAVGAVTVTSARVFVAGDAGPGRPPTLDPPLYDDEKDLTVAGIHVPAELFTAICPTGEELAALAHIREGGPPDATRALGTDPPPDEDALKGVLVASRFPAAEGGRHVVHLVSLDGHADYLPGRTAPPEDGLRLISLYSWTYTDTGRGTGFGGTANHLATAPDLVLRHSGVPTGGDVPQAAAMLRQGGTALPQGLESGETTIGFYRGAFTAAPGHDLPHGRGPRLETPEEALVYVEALGMYDASYAAAFSLGRQYALADADFRHALVEYRKAARHALRRILTFPELSVPTSRGFAAEVRANRVRGAFDRMLGPDGPLARARTRDAGDMRRAGRRAVPAQTPVSAQTAGTLRGALAESSTRAVLTAAVEDELTPVVDWLVNLTRVRGVPLGQLVPTEDLLPPESIRFFHVDPAWLHAVVDGALSVGIGHALDADLNDLARQMRAITQPRSGILMRSRLIPQWPGTLYTCYHGDTEIQPIHIETIDEDLVLRLFDVVVDGFAMGEPPQGLLFGIGDDGATPLRSIVPPIGDPRGQFPDEGDYGQFLRDNDQDVLDIEHKLGPALAEVHGVARLGSAQLALQLIKAPQLQKILRPGSPYATPEPDEPDEPADRREGNV